MRTLAIIASIIIGIPVAMFISMFVRELKENTYQTTQCQQIASRAYACPDGKTHWR